MRRSRSTSLLLFRLFGLWRTSSGWVLLYPYNAKPTDGYKHPTSRREWHDGQEGSSESGSGVAGPPFDLAEVAIRWPSGVRANDTRGLGLSITWAMAPDLCERILPSFPEEVMFGPKFVTCEGLRHALTLGFDVWASNHPLIAFHDVTDACALQWPCGELAELQIVARSVSGGADAAHVASVKFEFGSSSGSNVLLTPRLTNGYTIPRGVGALDAVLSFSTDKCFYLDPTFCTPINQLHSSAGQGGIIGMFVTITVMLASCLIYLIAWTLRVFDAVPAKMLRRWRKRAPACCKFLVPKQTQAAERVTGAMIQNNRECAPIILRIAKMPISALLVTLFGLIFLPIALVAVVLPCVQCYDFEATVAHEIGHVLGFDHPDTATHRNLHVDAHTLARFQCDADPLNYAQLSPIEDAASAGLGKPIMYSTTLSRSRTCLSPDDLNGLFTLYPVCGMAMPDLTVCNKPKQLAGIARLLCAVMIPYMVVTALVLTLQALLRSYQRRLVKDMEREAIQTRSGMQWMRTIRQGLSSQNQQLKTQARNANSEKNRAVNELQKSNANNAARAASSAAEWLSKRCGAGKPPPARATDVPSTPAQGSASATNASTPPKRKKQARAAPSVQPKHMDFQKTHHSRNANFFVTASRHGGEPFGGRAQPAAPSRKQAAPVPAKTGARELPSSVMVRSPRQPPPLPAPPVCFSTSSLVVGWTVDKGANAQAVSPLLHPSIFKRNNKEATPPRDISDGTSSSCSSSEEAHARSNPPPPPRAATLQKNSNASASCANDGGNRILRMPQTPPPPQSTLTNSSKVGARKPIGAALFDSPHFTSSPPPPTPTTTTSPNLMRRLSERVSQRVGRSTAVERKRAKNTKADAVFESDAPLASHSHPARALRPSPRSTVNSQRRARDALTAPVVV